LLVSNYMIPQLGLMSNNDEFTENVEKSIDAFDFNVALGDSADIQCWKHEFAASIDEGNYDLSVLDNLQIFTQSTRRIYNPSSFTKF